MKNAKDLISNLFNTGHIVAFVWRNAPNWPVEYVSDSLLSVFGYHPTQYLDGSLAFIDQIHPEDLARVTQELLQAIQDKQCQSFEHTAYRFLSASGSYRWVKDVTNIERDAHGEVLLLAGYLTDITKETEFQERLDLAWNATDDGLWDWQIDRNDIYYSDRWKSMIGYQPDEFPNTVAAFMTALHPDDQPIVDRNLKHYLANPHTTPFELEFRLRCQDGAYKWIRGRGKAIVNAEGRPCRMLGSHSDISEQKNADKQIETAKNYYATLLASATDAIHVVDQHKRLIDCSDSFMNMLGYTKEEIRGLSIEDWEAGYNPEQVHEKMQQILKGPIRFETLFKKKNGDLIQVDITARHIIVDDNLLIYASARDMTEANTLKEAIVKERNFISTIVNNANAIIAVIQADGTMSHINRYGQDYVGYTQEEVASEPYFWARFIDESARDKVVDIIAQANQGNIVQYFQNSWFSRDGEARIFEWSNGLIQKTDGSLDYVFTIGIDITESEHKKQEFETIFNTSKDGVAILDLQSNFIEFNDAYLAMTGFTREELLTKSCIGMSVPEDVERAKNAIAEVMAKGFITNFEKTCFRKNGSRFTTNMAIALMPDKQHILVNNKDVTADKLLKIGLLHAKEAAEQATKSKSEFLANMSHEIRTPLNGVIGLNTLLLNTPLNTQQAEYVHKSLLSAKTLLGVINDILDYSKIEAGKFELSMHAFSLYELLQTTRDLFDYAIAQKGLKIHIVHDPSIPSMLTGDALRITQVLNNLVGNAVKFTHHGDITIKTEQGEATDHGICVTFSVSDSGIGMDETELTKLFHSFTQTDTSNTRKYGGTGLGLVITKRLIELMDGKIWVESTKGVGSTFYFTVLFTPSDIEPSVTESPTTRSNSEKEMRYRGKILVAEDNEINQLVIRNVLEGFGLSIDIAQNGAEAVQRCREDAYDLVLMDIQMPILDGFDATKSIRTFNATLPIIALSAAVMQQDQALATEAGMNGHLAKPIDVAALEQVFSTYLQPDDAIISPAQTDAPAPRLPDIEGIDLHHLNSIFSDPNQVIEILKTFAHSQRDFCRKLHEVALDSPIFKRKIHALKGVSGSMAANEVHQQCKAIELATNASAKQTLVNTLCTTLSRLIHAIEAIHHNQASDRDQLIEPSHAQSIIDTTLAKLDANEFIASEERNRFFVAITHFEHDQRLIRQLEETFSIFDFKQAAAIIREIKSKHHGQ